MNASEKQANKGERGEKIKERYKGVEDRSRIIVIPATPADELALEEKPLKVAAYVRVSTENDEQKSSYELQVNEFTDRIKSNPHWEFAGIYSDEGISGTELSHRKGMLQMIEDAKAGKIQHILAKSIARFARNVVDCLSVIEELRKIGVGVHFDEANLYTLDATGNVVLTIMATVAEEESRSKSFIMNWSVERRFQKGIFLTPALLGYDKDEDGRLVINEEEAETVKVIFYLFLNGWSHSEIADLLTQYGRKTKLGNQEWNPTSIAGIIENERHCGYVIARKTYTPNFKDHKSVKNTGQRNKYIDPKDHDPIVSKDVYDAANKLQASMKFAGGNRVLPVLSVIDDGILRGYVPVHKDWTGFTGKEYVAASQSACETEEATAGGGGKEIHMPNFKVVRGEYFPSLEKPALTIDNGRFRFNTACLKKFEDVEYVELLLNPVIGCLAVRPCEKDSPNAIHWGKLKENRWIVSQLSCRGLTKALVDTQEWNCESKYRLLGQFRDLGDEKLILFAIDEAIEFRTDTQVIVPEQPDNADPQEEQKEEQKPIVITEQRMIYPASWEVSFGVPLRNMERVSLLERQHYAGDWDVLCPARELDEMNILTAADLDKYMKEAEAIMEGWKAA